MKTVFPGRLIRTLPLFLLVMIGSTAPSIGSESRLHLYRVTDDGAWCWFHDQGALVVGEQLVAGSVSGGGDVRVSVLNLASGKQSDHPLKTGWRPDDHNVPGLLLRDDGHVMAFYCGHSWEPIMYMRETERPHDATAWGEERTYQGGTDANFTYANPVQLSAEEGRIYNFWRAIDFNPTFAYSDDNGKNWSDARNILYWKEGQRPYVKYASDSEETIHFAFTEGHPRNHDNGIFHAFYRDGWYHRSDGTRIKPLEEGPLSPEEATQVYSPEQEDATGRGWIWDLALDEEGRPAMVYSTRLANDDLHYRYARWNADRRQWEERQIAHAGVRLYNGENDYAGGITIDQDNVDIVYLSSNVNIGNGAPNTSGRYEIYRGRTSDSGGNWEWQPLTENSEMDNLRPIVPANHPGETFVLWMRGEYRTYVDYDLEIVLKTDRHIPGAAVTE